MKLNEALPSAVARKLFLMRQCLWEAPRETGSDALYSTVQKLGLLQIDSNRTVERSHYITLFSRVGCYQKADFDKLVYPDCRLTEQWAHVASLIPAEDLASFHPIAVRRRSKALSRRKREILGPRLNSKLGRLLALVNRKGTVMARDINEPDSVSSGDWWRRTPGRTGLEVLFRRGHIFVQRRINFEKLFASTKLFIAGWPKNNFGSRFYDKAQDWVAYRAVRCIGIATLQDVADYYRQSVPDTRLAINRLVSRKRLCQVKVQGWNSPAFVAKADLAIVSKLLESDDESAITTFLCPFDNLIWNRARTERIFGLTYRTQMYRKKSERDAGYFVMPILHKGNIIGTADLRADRAKHTLIVNWIKFSPHLLPDLDALECLSRALVSLATFAECSYVEVVATEPSKVRPILRRKLRKWIS